MKQHLRIRMGSLTLLLGLVAMLFLGGALAACSGSGGIDTADVNYVSLAQLVGQPTAQITSGASFEVTGKVKNLDNKQHDIHLKATLKDASGQVVGTATGLADNVPGGQTVTYTLQGTLTQPSWSTVTVVITKVTENVNGQGSD
jgi:hypothetical protein